MEPRMVPTTATATTRLRYSGMNRIVRQRLFIRAGVCMNRAGARTRKSGLNRLPPHALPRNLAQIATARPRAVENRSQDLPTLRERQACGTRLELTAVRVAQVDQKVRRPGGVRKELRIQVRRV